MLKCKKKQMGWRNEPDSSDPVSRLSTGYEPGLVRQQPTRSSSHLHLSCRGKLSTGTICDAVDGAAFQVGRLPGCRINAWLASDKKEKIKKIQLLVFPQNLVVFHFLSLTIRHEFEISHAEHWEWLPAVLQVYFPWVRRRQTVILET